MENEKKEAAQKIYAANPDIQRLYWFLDVIKNKKLEELTPINIQAAQYTMISLSKDLFPLAH